MTNKEKQKYIDAFKYWCETNEECGVITIPKFVCDNIIEILDNAPTVEERPKGKWIGDTDYESCQGNYEAYKCSECGYGIDWRKHHQLMCQDKIPEEYREYYCPHCGADMRGYV